jgi:predicted nucleic-acid-binding protein
MIALDTNILARLIFNDDPDQVAKARQLIAENNIYIPKTVLLELSWVIGSSSAFGRNQVVSALSNLVRLPNLTLEDEDVVFAALDHAAKGMDFADALHLESSPKARWLATFDKDFIKFAKGATPPVRQH